MGVVATRGLTWRVALRLGRVSNLPTVWSNVLAGVVLAGRPASGAGIVALALGCALLYVGGMLLNDAFDHPLDARERPERPIPAGI
ncbi:MAG: UbiA family prenyltransferase, partial [Candidatus Eremiobacteraeota bacterium]|nr:UbiA family prenyltransferase [Candidatus Eremiobacteraeota bacterium]